MSAMYQGKLQGRLTAALISAIAFTGVISTAGHASEEGNANAFIWQGFNHEWRRFVVLPLEGRVPHRISKLASYVEQTDAGTDGVTGQIHFAQSTGVDGNYMWPQGYYSAVAAPQVTYTQNSASFSWTDSVTGDSVPIAESRLTQEITIDIPRGNRIAPVLNGIDLDVRCDDLKQPSELPCNSNGLWPYKFAIAVDECQLQSHNTTTETQRCPIHVTLNRGWTPNRGGLQIPPFFNEIKPLNRRLDIELTVHYGVFHGAADALDQISLPDANHTQALQSNTPHQGAQTIQWQGTGQATTVSAITGFGFELTEPLFIQSHWQWLQSDTRQRGRYIGKLQFSVANPTTSGNDQLLTVNHRMHVWSPITVVDSLVTTTLSSKVLVFSEASKMQAQERVTGRLCINSTDQAPAFSRWEHCNLPYWWARWLYGTPQSSDTVSINAGF